LDQLALSNLTNAQSGASPKSEEERFWGAALERLSRLVRLQLLGCPRSNFHEEEGLVWSGYEALRAMGRRLSAELEFHDCTVIRNGQLYLHCQRWKQGKGDEVPGVDVDRVLEGDRFGWQPRLFIDVKLGISDDVIEELIRARSAEDEGLSEVWAGWSGEGVSFDDRVREEAHSYGPVVLEKVVAHAATFLSVQSGLRGAGVPEDRLGHEAAEYLRSDSLIIVPFNRISSLLYAALARRARAGQKGVSKGMTSDIRMISTLLPYVDAMFVDRECHVLLSENPIPERLDYDTRLFSHRNKEEFIAYLDEIEASATPEHLALIHEVYGAPREFGSATKPLEQECLRVSDKRDGNGTRPPGSRSCRS